MTLGLRYKVDEFMAAHSARPVVADAMIDSLSLRNRAYQVLYALGESSSTVRTLTAGEAACLVGIVQDIGFADRKLTESEHAVLSGMSASMVLYVATGSLAAQPQIHAESASTPRV